MRKKKDLLSEDKDDIFVFDDKFKKMFENDMLTIPQLQKKIEQINKKIEKSITDGQRENLYYEKINLENKIYELENNELYTLYLIETTPILDEYKSILEQKCVDTFIGKSETNKFTKKKQRLLHKYIKIAKKYDRTFILPNLSETQNNCDNCKSKNIEMEDERLGFCLDCGAIKEYLINVGASREHRQNHNDSKVHLLDVVQKFQGKQNTYIKDEIYEKIDEILDRYKLLNDSDRKSVKYSRVTKDDIQMALEECHYTHHYDDCQLIFTNLTGKPGPDLSDYMDRINEDHDKVASVYADCVAKVREKYNSKYVRESFMSGHYLLFQFLTRYKYPCKKEDFNILKSDDPLLFHDLVYEEICSRFGWTMIYLK